MLKRSTRICSIHEGHIGAANALVRGGFTTFAESCSCSIRNLHRPRITYLDLLEAPSLICQSR
jgi:hypothetical protein